MTFADGWTCRACWKPNGAQDPLCVRRKTPFEGAGLATIAGLVMMYTKRDRAT